MSLRDKAADFLAEKRRLMRRGNLSAATVEQYRHVMESIWLPWCDEQRGLDDVADCTDDVLERFTDHLAAKTIQKRDGTMKRLSVVTVRTYIRAVRVFLTWAKAPKGDYRPPKEPRRLVDTLTRQEIDRMERAARDERDKLIVRVLGDTGIRISELLGLRPADLRANAREHRYFIRVIGKGDKEREVAIPKETFERLKRLADHTRATTIFFARRGEGEMTHHAADKMMHRLAEQAGIGRRVTPHLFRHSYITNQIARGTNLEAIRRSVGHTSLAMIVGVYSHVTPDDTYDMLMAALK